MAASVFFLVPLSTYNLKDLLNNSTKLTSSLMCQKVFSMQMSSAVGIKMNENSYTGRQLERGIQQTSKEDERSLRLLLNLKTKIGGYCNGDRLELLESNLLGI
jgi:hypothetical protein